MILLTTFLTNTNYDMSRTSRMATNTGMARKTKIWRPSATINCL